MDLTYIKNSTVKFIRAGRSIVIFSAGGVGKGEISPIVHKVSVLYKS